MDQQKSQFTYFISEKELPSQNGILLLIALTGPVHRSAAPAFEKLIEELAKKAAHWVILNLRDIDRNVDRAMFPALTKLQKIVRDKPAELKLCGLNPEVRRSLEAAGIIRSPEVVNNLEQALTSLSPRKPEAQQPK